MRKLGIVWKQPKKQKKYYTSFGRIRLYNRWNHPFPPDDWCIIGIYKRWFGSEEYSYRICFFGLESHVLFKREFK